MKRKRYSIQRRLASSGFCTVEHFYVRCNGKDLNGYWSREQAQKDIAERRRIDAQVRIIRDAIIREE